jgi:hypothetical protein
MWWSSFSFSLFLSLLLSIPKFQTTITNFNYHSKKKKQVHNKSTNAHHSTIGQHPYSIRLCIHFKLNQSWARQQITRSKSQSIYLSRCFECSKLAECKNYPNLIFGNRFTGGFLSFNIYLQFYSMPSIDSHNPDYVPIHPSTFSS